MNQTTFQPAEIYDSNGNLIQQGAFGINTPFASSTGDGVYDYIVNNLYALKDMIAAGYIAVATLPASGQTNKYYVITEGANAGKCYIWTGSAWQELTTQINGKSAYEIAVEHGFIGTEQQWLDSFTADAIAAANRAEAAMEAVETGLETLEGIDARFANVEDHAKMTDSNVDATKKRISNVEKLLQGNLYDYQTDETVAYEKTVPAGAMPYAGIERIGGKTVVWNQLVAIPSADISKTENGITFTDNRDGSFTVSGTATADAALSLPNLITIQTGHKYIMRGCPSGGSASTFFYVVLSTMADTGIGLLYDRGTPPLNSSYPKFQVKSGTEISTPIVWKPQIVDLTLMFGSGNEPSKVAEFEAMFPADYYAYNAGTLLSAGVTEVESQSANLADINIVKKFYPTLVTIVSADEFTFVSSGSMSATNRFFDNVKKRSDQITISYSIKYSDNVYSGVYLRVYYTDGTFDRLYNNEARNQWQNVTWTSASNKIVDYITWSYVNGATLATIKKLQIEWGTTATDYSPYGTLATMPIPAEVQALEGYGWSAGSVYNYIDYERKVFVQNVAKVDLGTLTWKTSSTSGCFYATAPQYKYTNTTQMVCGRYVFDGYGQSGTRGYCGDNKTIRYLYQTAILYEFYIHDDSVSDVATLKASLDGQYLYYELANPIETDISAYLSDDNLIEVESGGTLTMYSDANGDDDAYHIPVPSTVEYMIDLNVATGGTTNEP